MMRVKKVMLCEMINGNNNNKVVNKRNNNSARLLINVNVPGSAGALRLVVNEEDKVVFVIGMALKLYVHQGRLPLLASHDPNHFFLYPTSLGLQALSGSDMIGLCGVRNFMLCKKQVTQIEAERNIDHHHHHQKGIISNCWKTWLIKSFSFNIHSH